MRRTVAAQSVPFILVAVESLQRLFGFDYLSCKKKVFRSNSEETRAFMSTAGNTTPDALRINQALLAHLLEQPVFRCPLDPGAVLTDPVILVASGLSYNRAAITAYLALHGTDPETDRAMGGPGTGPRLTESRRRLVDNIALREMIARMVQSVAPATSSVEDEEGTPVVE